MPNLYLDTLGYRSPPSLGDRKPPSNGVRGTLRAARSGTSAGFHQGSRDGNNQASPTDGAGKTKGGEVRRTVRFADGREVEASLELATHAPWTITANVPGTANAPGAATAPSIANALNTANAPGAASVAGSGNVPGLGAFKAEARDLFDALCAVRDWLAGHNAVLLVAGAARDVYPSGMMREAGGRMAYRMVHGQAARRSDAVDIMAPAEPSSIAGVAEQKENFASWIKSLQPPPQI